MSTTTQKPPTPHAQAPQRTLQAILLVSAAVLVFACMDSTTKYLSMRYSVSLVVAARYVVNLIMLVVFFAPKFGLSLFVIRRKKLVWLRAISLSLASLCAGLALKTMPVAETTAIIYLAPFGVLLLSAPLLGEKVKLSGWIATVCGFLGLLLIARPGSGLSTSGIIYALLCAATTMIYHLLSRLLAKTESTEAMLFYTALAGSILFVAILPWSWQTPSLSELDVVLFISMGAFALGGHFLFTAAYRLAPASLLTPVNYVHLVWASLLGWLIFNHVPDFLSICGLVIIVASGAGTALWNHLRRGRSEGTLAPD